MNHRKPKMAKFILGLNLGLHHHVLNSCCPYKPCCGQFYFKFITFRYCVKLSTRVGLAKDWMTTFK